ncbi:DAK1 domain protein [Dictyocaulus viviparus]|uniref:DAK1 domain protein n=1 Tax=Dictyocaulus viviparus TaxID=29172 RepID=A0A0D8XCC8_DICVI|nr:DAK1 domain protein [Dictyocaulus viviparus]
MSTTKKFINEPSNAVDDALDGLVNATQCIIFDKNCRRVTLRSDYTEYCARGLVALIAGGGSGHEPFAAGDCYLNEHCLSEQHIDLFYLPRIDSWNLKILVISGSYVLYLGYIGSGMLTAAISGNVFASPPSRHISAALNSTTTRGGSILFVINYTGDRLNFGLAAERYTRAGHHVRIVSIADDVAIEASKLSIGPRGLAAAVLIIKIAGAMAESGKYTVEQIESMANQLSKDAGSMGVSLYPCSLPGFGQIFEIPKDMMEIGFGIHGEPGSRREPVATAQHTVDIIMTKLHSVISLTKGQRIALLINNLGGVSQLELNIIKSEAIKWCREFTNFFPSFVLNDVQVTKVRYL